MGSLLGLAIAGFTFYKMYDIWDKKESLWYLLSLEALLFFIGMFLSGVFFSNGREKLQAGAGFIFFSTIALVWYFWHKNYVYEGLWYTLGFAVLIYLGGLVLSVFLGVLGSDNTTKSVDAETINLKEGVSDATLKETSNNATLKEMDNSTLRKASSNATLKLEENIQKLETNNVQKLKVAPKNNAILKEV
ncbi:hypothetical protein [Helicobacter cetorum]|uniref:hypothetical protein n=1 Tax=Helicobacter cetorum TaxID=138563 RepID=UPI000CF0B973|nr:hypothetical protein [Helicobacter cetorum]